MSINPAHLHLALNHVPVLGVLFGLSCSPSVSGDGTRSFGGLASLCCC
jgi:hypothetical protein